MTKPVQPDVTRDDEDVPFAIGQDVRTPSGAIAELLAIYRNLPNDAPPEVLVQWHAGDRARFLLSQIRRPLIRNMPL